jgi:chaperonin GroEL
MIKEISDGQNHLKGIVEGVRKAANTVAGTLGPLGKTVIIDDNNMNSFTPSKDGFAVAKAIELADPVENIGAKAVHKVCKHVADVAGDGTTTAAVLFSSMIQSSANLVMSNQWSRGTANGIDYAIERAIQYLTKQAEHINSNDIKRIAEIATISTNNDALLGQLVSEIVSKVGPDGVVSVSDSKSMNTHYTYIDGMKIKQGFASPHFKTSNEKEVCEMESVKVLVYSGNIDTIQKLAKMEAILKCTAGEPLMIFCSDMNSESVLATLVVNNARGLTKICVSKLPGYGDSKNKMAEDIALFVGAKFIDESKGMDLSKCVPEDLGKANKIIADASSTTIIGGQGSEAEIKARCHSIENQISELGNSSEYQRNTLQDRLAGLKGIAAVVHVGGMFEEQQKEIKYRLEDAIQAAKSAVKHGAIPGGSSSLVRASKHLAEVKNEILKNPKLDSSEFPFSYINSENKKVACCDHFIRGIDIVSEALCAPLQQILTNAGMHKQWQTIIHSIQTHADDKIGYDVTNMRLVNMYQCGIIDPLSSPVEALKVASSVSSMMAMSHASITHKREEKESAGHHGMPGMY